MNQRKPMRLMTAFFQFLCGILLLSIFGCGNPLGKSGSYKIVGAGSIKFLAQPADAVAGQVISPAVQVAVLDSAGAVDSTYAGPVTIELGTNSGSATLNGTLTVNASAGVANFSDLTLTKTASDYDLQATVATLDPVTSASFAIMPGNATQLAFTTQPQNASAATTISPSVQVAAEDVYGNVVTGFTGQVTLAIGSNPNTGVLSGTLARAAVNGVATFTNLSIDKAGIGYTLNATTPSLSSALSTAIDISVGAAAQLQFTVQPQDSTGGTVISPNIQVTAFDAGGNVVTGYNGAITLSLASNPGLGALSGSTVVTASSGVASFTNVSIDKFATGYTLTASASGLTAATSSSFDIAIGAATKLVFQVPPADTTSSVAISPAIRVAATDAGGNIVPGFSGSISLAIGTNPNSGTLSGTTSVSASNGIASFTNLSIDKAGSGYTLNASSSGLSGVTSSSFNITAGVPTHLVFLTQPTTTTSTSSISPAIQIAAEDAGGNIVNGFTSAISISIASNPGSGSLSGMSIISATNGISTFSNLSIDKAGTGYTLLATAGGLTGATSASFNILVGSATHLAFSVQPTDTNSTEVISPNIQVSAEDAGGNVVPSFTNSITIAIGTNPNAGLLSGTKTVAATSGTATFTNLSIDKASGGYTLTASTSGLTGATSSSFSINVGTPTQLAFITQPSNATAATSISPAIQVAAQDAGGNIVVGFSSAIAVAIASNPGAGILSGTTSVTAVNGVSTFANLSINKSGAGYTLTASASGLTSGTSLSFAISAGTATQLAFTSQPTSAVSTNALNPTVTVSAEDAQGNVVTSFSGAVTIAFASNPGSGVISGSTTVSATNGVSTFSNLSVDKAGTGYSFIASTSGLTSATSANFSISVGAATRLSFVSQPTDTTSTSLISPAIQVAALDAGGNTVTSFSSPIIVAIGNNPNAGVLSGSGFVSASSGVSTFSDLSIDKAGSGYTLTATSSGLTSATSANFNVAVGAATHLAFIVAPTNTTATNTISPSIQVAAEDAGGNIVTSFSNTIDIVIASNPGTGTLSGSLSVSATSGSSVFGNLSIDKAGNGYTLMASSTGLTSATSTSFNVTVGAATHLEFKVGPTNTTAGQNISPSVQVSIADAGGNIVTTASNSVSLTIASNPGLGTLSGTTSVAAVNGIASFGNLNINKSGTGYALAASASGLLGATSSSFNISPAAATKLAFTVGPSNTLAAVSINPAIQVSAQDAFDNVVTGYSGDIAIAIGTNPGGGTLSGTTTVTAALGVSTFSGISIDNTGLGYTLVASATGFSNVTSSTFAITSTKLVITTSPSATGTAGVALTIQPVVTFKTNLDVVLTSETSAVTLEAFTDSTCSTAGSGVLSANTNPVNAVNGVATFSGVSYTRAQTIYLKASSPGVSSACSSAIVISPGAASKLAFTTQPSNAAATIAISPALQVSAQDSYGNSVPSFTGSVSVALDSNPGSGTLSGTSVVAASSGTATFANLSINKAATGYSLIASASGLTSATSSTFNINVGSAAYLVISTQPSNTTAATTISPAVEVIAKDAGGNTVTSFTNTVNIAIASNPGSGALSGLTSVSANAGVATFSNLSIDKAGVGYTLSASSTGLTSATTNNFTISVGSATRLAFISQPTNAVSTNSISPNVQVAAQDAGGNTVTSFSAAINIAISTNPVSGSLSGTTTATATNGVASFGNLSIDKAGSGYSLVASTTGLTNAISSGFDISVGPAHHLVIVSQPTNAFAATAISPAVTIAAQDAGGNVVTSFTNPITVSIASNPSSGVLSGSNAVSASNGVSTFTNLNIDKAGAGYTLSATATGLTGAVSSSFTILVGSVSKLAFITQPTNASSTVSISPAVQVAAQDSGGNTVTSYSGPITVAIGNNPGSGTLSGTTSVAAVNGVSTFTNLSINKAASGYTLNATGTGLSSATSSAFNITVGSATQLVFTVAPTNATAAVAISPSVEVTALDAGGNTVTGFSGTITIAINNNPGGGTLSGTKAVSAASGVSSFSNLSINKSGTGYTLIATSTGLASATSLGFNINAGAPSQLAFSSQPTNTTSASSINPSVSVVAQDAQGNTVPSFTSAITVSISSNPGSGTLSGLTSVAATSGISSFSNLSINKAGVGYTLSATATGLTSATSSSFNITPAAASKLAIIAQPSNTTSVVSISPSVQVAVQDAQGNTVTTFTNAISIAIASNPSSGALSGVQTVVPTNGISSFSGLSIDKAGSGYTLIASATGVTSATTSAFNILVGPAYGLSFVNSVSNGVSQTALSPAVVVNVVDQGGNKVTAGTYSLTMSIGDDPSAGATLSGTTTVSSVNGVATFSNLKIDLAADGYNLDVYDNGGVLYDGSSSDFNITPGSPAKLVFAQQPSTVQQLTNIAPDVVVAVQDSAGNLVTTATNSVAIAHSGTGTLTGGAAIAAVNGYATFSNLTVSVVQASDTLTASSAGLTSATSSSFQVTANQLVFQQFASSTGTAGVAWAIQPIVKIVDGSGATVTASTANVKISPYTDSNCKTPVGGNIASNNKNAVAGVATFTVSSFSKATTFYLGASGTNLASACASSNPITLVAGAKNKLGFSTQPSLNSWNTYTLLTQPVVVVQDSSGNTVTTATDSITLAAFTDSACTTAVGAGIFSIASNQATAAAGIATFSGVKFSVGAGTYYLGATAAGLTKGCSSKIVVAAHQPIAASNLSDATCAITSIGGGISCWGSGAFGVLGQGDTSNASTPVQVHNNDGITSPAYLQNIVAIAVGYANACGADSSGNLYCWGQGYYGANGNNSSSDSYEPVQVAGPSGTGYLSNIVHVAVGQYYTCAVNSSGNVYCWGYQGNGRLGTSTSSQSGVSYYPVPVLSPSGSGLLSNIVRVTAGVAATCALSDTGVQYCWGTNTSAALGPNTSSAITNYYPRNYSVYPTNLVQIAQGNNNGCAVNSSGSLYCWGANTYGQTGLSSNGGPIIKPYQVKGGVQGGTNLTGVTNVSVGNATTCATTATGDSYCWGNSSNGQVGNSTSSTFYTVPQKVYDTTGNTGTALSNILYTATSASHTCAVSTSASGGNVYCWGANSLGALGINTSVDVSYPQSVWQNSSGGSLTGVGSQ